MEADKERQARRTHLQRAILDLRSQQASELARELLTSSRPKPSVDTTTRTSAVSAEDLKQTAPRRATSARTVREHRTQVHYYTYIYGPVLFVCQSIIQRTTKIHYTTHTVTRNKISNTIRKS